MRNGAVGVRGGGVEGGWGEGLGGGEEAEGMVGVGMGRIMANRVPLRVRGANAVAGSGPSPNS